MKNVMLRRRTVSAVTAAVMSLSAAFCAAMPTMSVFTPGNVFTAFAAESSVKILSSAGFGEGMYATFSV